MTIKINFAIELDSENAPSQEAMLAVAMHFYGLRAACFWGEAVSAEFTTTTRAERDTFREALNRLANNSAPEVNIQVEKMDDADPLKPLRDKAEARQGKPLVTVIGDDESEPLLRPSGRPGLVSELKTGS